MRSPSMGPSVRHYGLAHLNWISQRLQANSRLSGVDGSGIPSRPATTTSDKIWGLMKDCWRFRPIRRPLIPDIIERLDTLQLRECNFDLGSGRPSSGGFVRSSESNTSVSLFPPASQSTKGPSYRREHIADYKIHSHLLLRP